MTTLLSVSPPQLKGVRQGGYFRYAKRLVFPEHERDGEVYDRDRLARIVEKCNRRLAAGDWCPLVVGHTSKYNKESDHAVVGYAGPYELIDGVGENGESIIAADLWIYEKLGDDLVERFPRLSAEIWPEEDIFDPIALLGGTTPFFDMKLTGATPYRKTQREGESQSYEMEASVPSGSNSFLPPVIGREMEADKYMGEDSVAQLMQAIRPVIESTVREFVAEAMKVSEVAPPPSADGEGSEDDGGEEVAPDVTDNSGESLPAAGKAELETEPIKHSTGPDSMDESAEFRKQYMRDKATKFSALEDGVKLCVSYMAELDADDKEAMTAVLAEDSPADRKAFYAKVSAEIKGEATGSSAVPYSKSEDGGVEYERVRGERDDYKTKYERAQRELDQERLKTREAERTAVQEKRRGELNSLAVEYAMNVDSEMEDVADMSDAQFERFKSKVKRCYQRVPDAGGVGALAVEPERSSSSKEQDAQQKYHKRSMELAGAVANRGKHVPYAKIMKAVEESDGKVDLEEVLKFAV